MNVHRILVAAAFTLLAVWSVSSGCGKECMFSSQCARGQHCDFTAGECVDGCKGPEDCPPTARCNAMFGRCTPMLPVTPRDAATSSTAADATFDASLDASSGSGGDAGSID
jgi:hypothetical protein